MTKIDSSSKAICYFRNLVARIYREIRYLGTAGTYDALQDFYPVCKMKRDYKDGQNGRTWVKPVFDEIRSQVNVDAIEEAFASRLSGLRLEQIGDAFKRGNWKEAIGGRRWAVITEATLDLRAALVEHDETEMARLLEVIDLLKHNTRPVVQDFLEKCGGPG